MSEPLALSRQQRIANAWARYVQRPSLRHIKHMPLLRALTNLTAPMTYQRPPNMLQKPMRLTHNGTTVSATSCYIKHQEMQGTLLYLHGGGFVMGSLQLYQHLVARLGSAAEMRGVYVDYRLAPEHPFPAALDDALTAYQAMLADPDSGPIAIAGDSAGGQLVLALLLKLKSRNLPLPFAAIALSPLTNLTAPSSSFAANAETDHLLDDQFALRGARAYAGDHDRSDPLLSPIKGDFTAGPPIAIHYDTAERLSDDSRTMVDLLRHQGLDVTTEVSTGRTHVWHLNVGRVPEADASVAALGRFLQLHRPAS